MKKNVFKFLAQVLSAVVYTTFYMGVIYFIVFSLLPLLFVYVLTFPWWGILISYILLGGLLKWVIGMVQNFGAFPYFWIARKNVVSSTISVLWIVLSVGSNLYTMWKGIWGTNIWSIIFALIVTGLLVEFIFTSITAIIMAYDVDD